MANFRETVKKLYHGLDKSIILEEFNCNLEQVFSDIYHRQYNSKGEFGDSTKKAADECLIYIGLYGYPYPALASAWAIMQFTGETSSLATALMLTSPGSVIATDIRKHQEFMKESIRKDFNKLTNVLKALHS